MSYFEVGYWCCRSHNIFKNNIYLRYHLIFLSLPRFYQWVFEGSIYFWFSLIGNSLFKNTPSLKKSRFRSNNSFLQSTNFNFCFYLLFIIWQICRHYYIWSLKDSIEFIYNGYYFSCFFLIHSFYDAYFFNGVMILRDYNFETSPPAVSYIPLNLVKIPCF